MNLLNQEYCSILLKLAKRVDDKCIVWFNCPLSLQQDDLRTCHWTCYICQKDFIFKESLFEIDQHGLKHLENKNLLPFI